jgi:hypothetical protein
MTAKRFDPPPLEPREFRSVEELTWLSVSFVGAFKNWSSSMLSRQSRETPEQSQYAAPISATPYGKYLARTRSSPKSTDTSISGPAQST